MRIVLVRRRYDPAGGAELYLSRLASGLSARGHQVSIVAESWPGRDAVQTPVEPTAAATTEPGPGTEKQAGPALVVLGEGRGPRFHRLRGFAHRATEWLATHRDDYDVSLALDRTPGAMVFRAGDGVHRAWLEERSHYVSGIKRLSFRLNPLHRTQLGLERELLAHPALKLVIANSTRVAEELKTGYGLDEARIRLVPTGVDRRVLAVDDPERVNLAVRSELSIGGGPMLLFVGSGFERKGLAFALAALLKMRRPDAVLVVVGKDPVAPYRRLARRLGVESRVRFLGTRRDVPRLLSAADGFVLPTIYDPQSNACLEALAAGVPVVTTEANGAADFITPGVSGVVVGRPDKTLILAQAMDEVLVLRPDPVPVPSQTEHVDRVSRVLAEAFSKS